MKATMLLTVALFLAAAPAPDAATIAEISAQLIVLKQPDTLQAAEATTPEADQPASERLQPESKARNRAERAAANDS